MKAFIILLTSLLLTLNTLSVGVMWVQTSDNQTDASQIAYYKAPCHQISGLSNDTISLCGMDNCQCEHLNSAQVPSDNISYQPLSLASKAPKVLIAISPPPSPYLVANYRPPIFTLI